jgi:hypothetical protein
MTPAMQGRCLPQHPLAVPPVDADLGLDDHPVDIVAGILLKAMASF